MHDWTRVADGIYHAFHHEWIAALSHALNGGILPEDHYALPEQVAAGFGPDVLTLQQQPDASAESSSNGGGLSVQTRPRTRFTAATSNGFRRAKSALAVRHVSGDRIVAMIEVVSPGNKASRREFRTFVDKAVELLERRIHLLVVDPFPPTARDPNGVHSAIWAEIEDDAFQPPPGQPLTFVSYECAAATTGFIEALAVGEPLPQMPLFLSPDHCIAVPLEQTYNAAFAEMPARWRRVLETPAAHS